MRILVAGAKGQLGSDCVEVLSNEHELLALDLPEWDILNLAQMEETMEDFSPECVLNCAAYTRVDDCETHKDLAFAINVTGPKNLALCAHRWNATMIHISTDYVFDGKKPVPLPYVENDPTAPVSYYAVTKFESERIVRETCKKHMIIRTAWLYGIVGLNFPKTMLRLTLQDPARKIKVVNDQFGSPTWSRRLATQIGRLIEARGQGVYHATAEGYCSWYEFAVAFLERMGLDHHLVPCTSDEYPTPAARPKNSILENQSLKAQSLNCMNPWQEDLDAFVSLYGNRLVLEAREGVKKV